MGLYFSLKIEVNDNFKNDLINFVLAFAFKKENSSV